MHNAVEQGGGREKVERSRLRLHAQGYYECMHYYETVARTPSQGKASEAGKVQGKAGPADYWRCD